MCIAETRAMPFRTPLFLHNGADIVGDADELLRLPSWNQTDSR